MEEYYLDGSYAMIDPVAGTITVEMADGDMVVEGVAVFDTTSG